MKFSKKQFFKIKIGRIEAEAEILTKASKKLIYQFLNLLPFETDLHYAKISGESLLFFVPFFIIPEKVTHINKVTQGSIAYWPNRQQIIIYYGKFEKEDASVMLLGRITNGLDKIATFGEVVKLNQGKRIKITY